MICDQVLFKYLPENHSITIGQFVSLIYWLSIDCIIIFIANTSQDYRIYTLQDIDMYTLHFRIYIKRFSNIIQNVLNKRNKILIIEAAAVAQWVIPFTLQAEG